MRGLADLARRPPRGGSHAGRLAASGLGRRGACDDPTDPSPHPRQIPNCQVLHLGPYGFKKCQHTYWNASCPPPNAMFLGNDDADLGDAGYELDNNCLSVCSYTPQFDSQFKRW